MRNLCTALLVLVVSACANPLAQTPPAGVTAQVAAPEPRTGFYFRYAVTDGFTKVPRGSIEYRVSAVGSDTVTVAVRSGEQQSTEVYTREGNWLRRPATNMQEFAYRPEYRAFDFPLAAGKTWKARAIATDPADGRSFPVTIEGTVLGWERIKVPAGEFDTLKIRRFVFLDYFLQGERGQSVIQETDWYAPQLNHVARRETTSTFLSHTDASPQWGFVRVGGDDHGDGAGVPRYVQDDWTVYELVATGRD